ncbi:hypothetical protein GALMADRAFT_138342 [Galerina marginata CBS 339.88]|uniref:F-box domain-containing protein n=1 Tax=Galerina marginata (strain CBS 339.88) TaxID=685588 RepID=A0A067T4V1_GALM3|nr:hypothetical protein GALMADRAFT_138342 [Galerina marginata CBS 339.88]
MLLTQICSYWRDVALDTSTIWEQLYHVSFVIRSQCPSRDVLRKGIHPADVEFLRWWSNNVYPRAPVLRLRLTWSKATRRGKVPEEDLGPFFTSFLSSAQYLDLGASYITVLQSWLRKAPLIFPNLQSLLLRCNKALSVDARGHSHRFQMIPIDTTHSPAIRKLYVERMVFFSKRPIESILPWTQLTHIRLVDTKIPSIMWSQLLRQCTNLQTGQFFVEMILNDVNEDLGPPPKAILAKLRQLHLTLDVKSRSHIENVFEGLQFPRLASFRFSAKAVALEELHRILTSMPMLTELQLFGRIPFQWHTNSVGFPSPEETEISLWNYVPHLERLFLDGSHVPNNQITQWFKSAYRTGWLQLGSGTNCLKRLDLTIEHPSDAIDKIARSQAALWVYHEGASTKRGEYAAKKLQHFIGRWKLEGVKIVLRDLGAPKIWSEHILSEDGLCPNFEDLGFYDQEIGLNDSYGL